MDITIEYFFDPDFVSTLSLVGPHAKYDAPAALRALRRKGFTAAVVVAWEAGRCMDDKQALEAEYGGA